MIKTLLALGFLAFISIVDAHDNHTFDQQAALAVNLALDGENNLWQVAVREGFIEVSRSHDAGKTFSVPVKINQIPQKIGVNGEDRPKIAISPQGYIYITWTELVKKPLAGFIWFARSVDAGKTFEKPYILHQDRSEFAHRLDALHVGVNGRITVAWVGKRHLIASKAASRSYDAAAIYYAVSENHGASFLPEQKLADSSCECCRIALASKPDGTVAALWRHVFAGSERDHMIAEIPAVAKTVVPKRATFGRWKVDGCPHHGPALASGGEGSHWWGYHMAWFDGGNDNSGKAATLYYARMDGEAWVSSPAKKIGNMKKQAAHPALHAHGEHVWLVWREKDAGRSQIWMMQSNDEGKSWDTARMVLDVAGAADYPLLLLNGKVALLAWNTENEGLKVAML